MPVIGAYLQANRVVDMCWHPRRHRRAKDQLRGIGRPRRLVVLCHGNICRSPYLAALLRRLIPHVEILSAGFVTPGRQVPEHALVIAARQGIDLVAHRSERVSRGMVAAADLIVTMETRQARHIARVLDSRARVIVAGDLDPFPGDRDIRDPWGQERSVFEATFLRLNRCANVVARELGAVATGDIHIDGSIRAGADVS
jgi:protein-tyrosine phosphatase